MEIAHALEEACVGRPRVPEVVDRYRKIVARLASRGVRRIEDVTMEALSAYSRWRLETVICSSLRLDFVALAVALRHAERLKAPGASAALEAVRAMAPRLARRQVFRAVYLERPAFDALLASATDALDAFTLRLVTLSGLRAAEACRLRWETDVDLGASPALHVREVVALGRAGRCKTGERRAPVCGELARILGERRERSGWVLPQRSDPLKPLSRGAAKNHLDVTRVHAQMPWVTFHVLRHTRAAWWLQAGVSLAKVSLWLGHSPETCARFYGALLQGYDPDCERVPAAWANLAPAVAMAKAAGQ